MDLDKSIDELLLSLTLLDNNNNQLDGKSASSSPVNEPHTVCMRRHGNKQLKVPKVVTRRSQRLQDKLLVADLSPRLTGCHSKRIYQKRKLNFEETL